MALTRCRRVLAATAVSVMVSVSALPMAGAIAPPDPNMSVPAPPADGTPKPPVPMKQESQCAQSALLDGTNIEHAPPANDAFQVNDLHKYATGKGIKVAVIDSGVNKSSRLPRLIPGGDYVNAGDGLSDCDHHGTLVAGIIGAQESANDGFIGVAPDAEIISIRQTSKAFSPEDSQDKTSGSTLATAASALVHAVNLGANVVNMSITSCYPATAGVDTQDIAAALKYAHDRGVAVVTSAGNADAKGCEANPQYDPAHPSDTRNWSGVENVSMPSYYSPFLISVGGSTLTGEPYSNTMAGPWVSVAAPAVNIVSLDPESAQGGLVNATVDDKGAPQPYNGTSFSSAYVAGLVALLMEKYPEDTPDQIKTRIMRTAHPASPGDVNIIGAGIVAPVQALTADVSLEPLPDRPTVPSQSAGGALWKKETMSVPLVITLSITTALLIIGSFTALIISMFNSATKIDDRRARGRSPREINAERRRTRRASRKALKADRKHQKEIRKESSHKVAKKVEK